MRWKRLQAYKVKDEDEDAVAFWLRNLTNDSRGKQYRIRDLVNLSMPLEQDAAEVSNNPPVLSDFFPPLRLDAQFCLQWLLGTL